MTKNCPITFHSFGQDQCQESSCLSWYRTALQGVFLYLLLIKCHQLKTTLLSGSICWVTLKSFICFPKYRLVFNQPAATWNKKGLISSHLCWRQIFYFFWKATWIKEKKLPSCFYLQFIEVEFLKVDISHFYLGCQFSLWWAWNLNVLLLIMENSRLGRSGEQRISVFREKNQAHQEQGRTEVIWIGTIH